MGQYFKYARATGSEGFIPSGLKCLEHSYIGNTAVILYHLLLLDKKSRIADVIRQHLQGDADVAKKLLGSWAGKPVVHAGDYENITKGNKNTFDKVTDKKSDSMYARFESALGLTRKANANPWDPYDSASVAKLDAIEQLLYLSSTPLYAVNASSDEFIDLRKTVLLYRRYQSKSGAIAFLIDPLSILTVKTDGGGGGDYYGHYEEEVGGWAAEHIYITDEVPEGMQELKLYFHEHFEQEHIKCDFSPNGLGGVLEEITAYCTPNLNACTALFNSYALLGFDSDLGASRKQFDMACGVEENSNETKAA